MKGTLTIAAIMLILTILNVCEAQTSETRFNLVENNSGEPLGKITAITQDPKGYMWFSGQEEQCLYRYDGSRFLTFRHDSRDKNSLSGTNPETVYADASGMIWIGFNGAGLDKYNPVTRTFSHYRHIPNNPNSLANDTVNVILKDHKGAIWVGTNNGLSRLDEKTGKFQQFRNEPANSLSLSSNVVRALFEDSKGVLWIGTGFPFSNDKPNDGGLNRLEPGNTFTRFVHDAQNPHSLINNNVRSIFEDSRGIFWIGTAGDGLHTMDRKSGTFERHLYNAFRPDQLSRPALKHGLWYDHVTFIKEDGSGAIWMGTYAAGINRYDPVTKKITHYDASNGFPDGSGWMAYTSADGVLWLTTQETNLFRIDPFLKTISSTAAGSDALSFHEDDEGFLWVGTDEKGLLQYDKTKKLVNRFSFEPPDTSGLFNNHVTSILQTQQDTIWLTTENGAGILNKRSRRFSRLYFNVKKAAVNSNEMIQVYQDRQHVLWFATLDGLIRYNPADGSTKQYHPNANDSTSISSYKITSVIQDRSGDFWFGAWLGGGLNRLNSKSGRFKHYIEGFNITRIYEDSQGSIWAGTEKGLFRYNKNSDSFSPFFDPQSEIGYVRINGIIEDDEKNLWISTQSAVVKLNPARTENFIYGKKFGIHSNSLNYGGIYKTGNGEILIGNHSGFYSFKPRELAISTRPFHINITDLFINNEVVIPGKKSPLVTPVDECKEITLKYRQNNLAFNFAATDYRAPEINKYFTMLEGYDNTWREASSEKSSFYLNVPPGEYTFRIKAFNSDGVKAEKSIRITVNPPWWKTWWAYSIYGLLLVSLGMGIYLFQKQHIIHRERQKAQVKELAQAKEIERAYKELKATQSQLIQSEKMASLGELTAGIAHEIQNPLNFINNFSDVNRELISELVNEVDKGNTEEVKAIANDITENEQKINHHGKRADAIVKGMLQHSRKSTGEKEQTDINALADEYLKLSYHGLRAKDNAFVANFKTDFDASLGKIDVVPQDMGRVLLNLYNNAFYAVNEKKKALTLKEENYEPTVWVTTKLISAQPGGGAKGLEISVKDNGVGILQKVVDKIFQPFFTTKPTGQGTGLGLSLSYDIIKAHGGELKVETEEGEGAEFIVVLPLY